jgi:TatA/E family protein of Tat protein translocase
MDGFFGISIWEILLVFVLVMIFVGPKKLPEIATKLGRTYRNLKRASQDLTSELTKEVNIKPDQKIENPLRKAASDLSAELGSFSKDLNVNADDTKPVNSKVQGKDEESNTST